LMRANGTEVRAFTDNPFEGAYCGVGAGPAGEQLLEPLALFERRLHPEVGGSRQNAFSERQDAFYIEFLELAC
jgi:hypothetical protein